MAQHVNEKNFKVGAVSIVTALLTIVGGISGADIAKNDLRAKAADAIVACVQAGGNPTACADAIDRVD